MTNVRRIALLAAGLIAVGVVVSWPRGATADKPPGCAQWEVMLASPGRVTLDAKALPEPGKSFIEQVPAGWEPFAFTPAGALVYRRCTK